MAELVEPDEDGLVRFQEDKIEFGFGAGARKNPKGKIIDIEQKEMVHNIYLEHLNAGATKSKSVKLTSVETGTSQRSLWKIVREMQITKHLSSPQRHRQRKDFFAKLNAEQVETIQQIINEFYLRSETPTLDKILRAVQKNNTIPHMGRDSLWRIIKKLPFKFEKEGNTEGTPPQNSAEGMETYRQSLHQKCMQGSPSTIITIIKKKSPSGAEGMRQRQREKCLQEKPFSQPGIANEPRIMSNPSTKKCCIVPQCFNTTTKTPDKVFFHVPYDTDTRENWINATKRTRPLAPKSCVYCCEDHFDIKNDMESYIKYSLVKCTVKLKRGVLPHKFECQKLSNDTPESLPREETQRKQWLNQLRLTENSLTMSTFVCNHHFNEDDITLVCNRRMLKPQAIPQLALPLPNDELKTVNGSLKSDISASSQNTPVSRSKNLMLPRAVAKRKAAGKSKASWAPATKKKRKNKKNRETLLEDNQEYFNIKPIEFIDVASVSREENHLFSEANENVLKEEPIEEKRRDYIDEELIKVEPI